MASRLNRLEGSFRTYAPTPNLKFDVIPINALDTTHLVKPFVTAYYVYLKGCLDSSKLRDSLEALVIQKYRVLASRLTSALDYFYVPRPESISRDSLVAFEFSSNQHLEHTVKSAVPSIGHLNARSDQITLHPGPPDLGIFEGPERALDEYFQHPNQPELNSPILKVHVEVLSDATFLSVQIPHLVTDARGFETILRSWATVMNDSLDEAPSPTPLGWNPLHGLGDSSKPANNSELIPSGWSCLVGDSVTKLMEATLKEFEEEPVTKNMSLHIPSSEIRRLRREAQQDISNTTQLSENDVLFAFLVRTWAASCASPSSTVVHLSFPIDLRSQLPERFAVHAGVYLHNGVFPVPLLRPLTVAQLQTMSLGAVALEVRKTITHLTQDVQEPVVDWVLANLNQNPIPRGTDGLSFVVSSWRRIKFLDMEFRGATLNPSGTGGRLAQIGISSSGHVPARRVCVVECDDGDGGVWCGMDLPEGDWTRGAFGTIKRNTVTLN
ncbi:transferase family domain-containing protein [Trichoderma camerunense]